jgi:quinol monooxygenase YgiN
MVIELTDILVKPDCVHRFIGKVSEFREILMALPGGVGVRCLQDEADACKFVFFTQWESFDAKQLFLDDPRLRQWASDYAELVVEQADRYFLEHL